MDHAVAWSIFIDVLSTNVDKNLDETDSVVYNIYKCRQKEVKMNISSSEWEVMRVVWASPKSSSTHVVEVLQAKYGWSVSTIKTLLARLVEKGHLTTLRSGRNFLYEATIEEQLAYTNKLEETLECFCQRQHFDLLYHILEELSMTQLQKKTLQTLLHRKVTVEQVGCQCTPGQCACKDCQCQDCNCGS